MENLKQLRLLARDIYNLTHEYGTFDRKNKLQKLINSINQMQKMLEIYNKS